MEHKDLTEDQHVADDENDNGDNEMRMKMSLRISMWRMMRMMMGMMR